MQKIAKKNRIFLEEPVYHSSFFLQQRVVEPPPEMSEADLEEFSKMFPAVDKAVIKVTRPWFLYAAHLHVTDLLHPFVRLSFSNRSVGNYSMGCCPCCVVFFCKHYIILYALVLYYYWIYSPSYDFTVEKVKNLFYATYEVIHQSIKLQMMI